MTCSARKIIIDTKYTEKKDYTNCSIQNFQVLVYSNKEKQQYVWWDGVYFGNTSLKGKSFLEDVEFILQPHRNQWGKWVVKVNSFGKDIAEGYNNIEMRPLEDTMDDDDLNWLNAKND